MRRLLATMTLLVAMTLGLAVAPRAEACPNCKDSVAATGTDAQTGQVQRIDDGYSQTSRAFNLSIYFMLASMYLVVGGLGGMAFYYFRKHAPDINRV